MFKSAKKVLDYKDTAFPSALAFSSAYIEVACFVGLFGLSNSFVTGNIILIGVELVETRPEVLTRLIVLPLFVLACAIWSWMFRKAARPSPTAIRAALFCPRHFAVAGSCIGQNLGR